MMSEFGSRNGCPACATGLATALISRILGTAKYNAAWTLDRMVCMTPRLDGCLAPAAGRRRGGPAHSSRALLHSGCTQIRGGRTGESEMARRKKDLEQLFRP